MKSLNLRQMARPTSMQIQRKSRQQELFTIDAFRNSEWAVFLRCSDIIHWKTPFFNREKADCTQGNHNEDEINQELSFSLPWLFFFFVSFNFTT